MADQQETVVLTVAITHEVIEEARDKEKVFLKGHPIFGEKISTLSSWKVVGHALNRAVEKQYGVGWTVDYPVMDDPWSSFYDFAILLPPGRFGGWDLGSRIDIPEELQKRYQSSWSYEPGVELHEVFSIELQSPKSPNVW